MFKAKWPLWIQECDFLLCLYIDVYNPDKVLMIHVSILLANALIEVIFSENSKAIISYKRSCQRRRLLSYV